jgi:hypothetical protein
MRKYTQRIRFVQRKIIDDDRTSSRNDDVAELRAATVALSEKIDGLTEK